MEQEKSLPNNPEDEGSNFELSLMIIQLEIIEGLQWLMSLVTRFYPFSLLFRDRSFHADWYDSLKFERILDFVSFVNQNRFKVTTRVRNELFFQLIGRFQHEPDKRLLDDIQKMSQLKDIEIFYQGEVEEGKYKFSARIDQKWSNVHW